jgi:hypothetical protein
MKSAKNFAKNPQRVSGFFPKSIRVHEVHAEKFPQLFKGSTILKNVEKK